MSSATDRRKSSGDEGGGANWMDTYGDLVTLLLTFFVLLFSFSSIDAAKWSSLVGAFSGNTVAVIPTLNPETAMEKPIQLIQTTDQSTATEESSTESVDYEQFMRLYTNIETYIQENHLQAEIYGNYETFTLIIRFVENILFESGSATLRSDSAQVLDHIIRVLEENEALIAMVRIEGHTDNLPIHTARFESNWELSVLRAVNALRYIIDSGRIDMSKISAVGYGEYHPVDTNDTAEGRSVNRRVDFVIESIKPSERN